MTLLEFIRDMRVALQEIRDAARAINASNARDLKPGQVRNFERRLEDKQRHIDELQASLTKRNATIAVLEMRVAGLESANRNLHVTVTQLREAAGINFPP